MLRKSHINFKSRLLAILFLFFNCVCSAAPVLKLANENYKAAVSTRLVQLPVPLENEEENRAASGYFNYINPIAVRKHSDSYVCNSNITNTALPAPAIEPSRICIPDASNLPMSGSDAFLFRYMLF
jgi:hypothetical protein